jgi:hypothetical protein
MNIRSLLLSLLLVCSVGVSAGAAALPLEISTSVGPSANNGGGFVVVLRVQDGYIHWWAENGAVGGARGLFAGGNLPAVVGFAPGVPPEVQAWGNWRTKIDFALTQVGNNIRADVTLGYARCGIGNPGLVSVTQSGSVTIANAVASDLSMEDPGFLGADCPNPLVQMVVRSGGYLYWGDLTITKSGLTRTYDWSHPSADLHPYLVPSYYAPWLGAAYYPSLWAAQLSALPAAWSTSLLPGNDGGTQYNLPQYHYLAAPCFTDNDWWVVDWRPA